MTTGTDGRAFAVAVWILIVAVAVAGTAGVLGGILSTSLVPDLVALWPLLAVVLVVGLVGGWAARRRGHRSRAILPLMLFSGIVLALSLHLGGWAGLPTAEARLTGPETPDLGEVAEFVTQIAGEIRVRPLQSNSAAYQVDPILRGGRTGVPEATETSVDGRVSIVLGAAAEAPSWYSFAGWEVALSPEMRWRVVLNGVLDADLTALTITSAVVAGKGLVRLGDPPPGGAAVIVAGDVDVVVPSGAGVAVEGDASVPGSWECDSGRCRSPAADEGDRWTISLRGDVAVTVDEG